MTSPAAPECPLCGEPPHTDWRTDDLGANHRSTAADLWRVSPTGVHLTMDEGVVGADPGDPGVNTLMAQVRNGFARDAAGARA